MVTNVVDINDKRIADEAAEWLLLLEENSAQHKVHWQQWMESDSRHRQAFEKMSVLWSVCDQLHEADLSIESDSVQQKDIKTSAWWSWQPLAIACSLVFISIFSIYHSIYSNADTKKVAPVIAATERYQTKRAEHETIRLSDGSVIELGARSAVEVSYTKGYRNITLLQGEAFFSVAKDHYRPFVVTAGERKVRAIGTAFEVNLAAGEMLVQVLEGIVRVASQKTKDTALGQSLGQRLTQGEAITVSQDGTFGKLENTAPEFIASWQHGYLSYQEQALARVISDLNRYSSSVITIDGDIDDLIYTGSIYNGRIDIWLKSLSKIYPLTVKQNEQGYIIRPIN